MHNTFLYLITELSLLLIKIHESFIALAAQLHAVHEAVQVKLPCLYIFVNIFTTKCVKSNISTDDKEVYSRVKPYSSITKVSEIFKFCQSAFHKIGLLVFVLLQTQKDHYMNYRKVFLGNTVDIFEKRRKAAAVQSGGVVKSGMPPSTLGPTPFTGMSNAAATAMASAINRTQQPAG